MEWNKEKLIEKYMDTPSELNVKAGIALAPPPPPAARKSWCGSPPGRNQSARAVTLTLIYTMAVLGYEYCTRRYDAPGVGQPDAGSGIVEPVLSQTSWGRSM